jgi:predicted nucleic acid-binding protein
MRVLLDTCILSELRHPHNGVLIKKTLEPLDGKDLFISVISVGEIAKGITLLKPSKRKSELQAWAIQLENSYNDRILTINSEVTHIWGELTAKAQMKGKVVSAADGLIAATALAHGLHVMTRNVSDFEPTGVFLLNPWKI